MNRHAIVRRLEAICYEHFESNDGKINSYRNDTIRVTFDPDGGGTIGGIVGAINQPIGSNYDWVVDFTPTTPNAVVLSAVNAAAAASYLQQLEAALAATQCPMPDSEATRDIEAEIARVKATLETPL